MKISNKVSLISKDINSSCFSIFSIVVILLRPKALFAMVEPEIKALVEKVAKSLGISQSDYVRFVVLQDLQNKGYLKGTVSLEQPVPMKTQMEVT